MIIFRPRYIEPGQEPGPPSQGFWERLFGYKPRYTVPPDEPSPDESPDEPSKEDRDTQS